MARWQQESQGSRICCAPATPGRPGSGSGNPLCGAPCEGSRLETGKSTRASTRGRSAEKSRRASELRPRPGAVGVSRPPPSAAAAVLAGWLPEVDTKGRGLGRCCRWRLIPGGAVARGSRDQSWVRTRGRECTRSWGPGGPSAQFLLFFPPPRFVGVTQAPGGAECWGTKGNATDTVDSRRGVGTHK